MDKKFLRIVSTVMVLILMITGIDINFFGFAHAEGSRGSMNASDAPDELLTFGEWQYWVENGKAIIAGYNSDDETTLKIPYQLGGYPVTGIGQKAFSTNSNLKNVNIHTNVTSIARDAFSGLNITISAYHGAFALRYANTIGIAYEDLTTIAEFAEGVIDLTGLSTKAYRNLSDYNVVFVEDEATFIQEGQIVYFPPQKGYTTGLGSVISSIDKQNGLLYVTMTRPNDYELLKRLRIEEEVVLDWENAVYYPGFEPSDTSGMSNHNISDKHTIKLDFKLKNGAKVTGAITFGAKYTVSIDIGWKGILPSLNTAVVKEDKSITVNVNVSKKESSSPTKLHMCDLPIASIGAITGYISVGVSINVKGEVAITYSTHTITSYERKNGKTTETHTKDSSFSGSISASFTFGPSIELGFIIGFSKTASVKFLEISGGLFYEASAKITATSITGTAPVHFCYESSGEIYVELGVKLGIIEVFGKTVPGLYGELKGKIVITKLKDNHYDFSRDNLVNDLITTSNLTLSLLSSFKPSINHCDLLERKVVFRTGTTNTEKTYNVNAYLKSPYSAEPTRQGYYFDGWYVNTKDSKLSGPDYKVIFGKTKMPYCEQNGTLYIDAKWVDRYPVTAIKLNKNTITGFSDVGVTDKLSVTEILPTNANNKNVEWTSSNTKVATVDQKGNVKLLKAGNAIITCTSASDVKATCNVEVKQSVTGIDMSPNNVFRYSNNMEGFPITSTVKPFNAVDKTVVWSSDNTTVASVSNEGYVTINGLGTATIICKSEQNPKVIGKCTIAVRQAVTGVTLDKTAELRTNANMNSIQLEATVAPEDAFNKALTWTSSDTDVATVTANGLISMKGVGETVITCTSISNPNITDTFELEIIQAVTDILLNEKSITKYSNQTEPIQLIPQIYPDNAGNKSVTWSTSDDSVAIVDSKGLVTISGTNNEKEAHAIITCQSVSDPDVKAECRFTVLQSVTDIVLNYTTLETSVDEVNPSYLKATVFPEYAYNKAIVWTSSNPEVASVSNDGIVVYKSVGQTIITCESVSTPGVIACCTVNVTEGVTGLSLNESSIVRYSNQKDGIQLKAFLESAAIADREIRWESDDENIATVTDSGIVNTHGVGSTTITCTSVSNPDVYAKCLIIVRQSVTDISLSETTVERYSNELSTLQLIPTVNPSTADNTDLIWASNELSVATVDDFGTVTPVGPGSAVITCRSASDPEVFATCQVTVLQAVTGLRLNITEVTRYTSDTNAIQLAAYSCPSYAYNKGVVWKSSNPDVAVVSENGTVRIINAGQTIITCGSVSNPALTAECIVEIKQAVTSITLNENTLTLYSDCEENYDLTASILPDYAADKLLVWESSNPSVVNVSDNGQITVSGTGVAAVSCRAANNLNAYAVCSVTVLQGVESILLNENEIVCYSDDTTDYQLAANIQPSYTDNKSVTWRSSNPNVVSVNNNGKLTIVGIGNAIITCTSNEDPSVTTQCNVTVKQPMTGIELSQTAIEMYSDDEDGIQLTAKVIPFDTDETDLIWKSDNEYVTIVSDTGLVKAVRNGSAHITCRSVRMPNTIFASCDVIVKQRVEAIDIEGNTASLLPGETVQLKAECYPEYSDNPSVIWSISNPEIATVSDTGLVTAVTYGTVTVTATTIDGGQQTAEYTVSVEHELVLETVTDYDSLYAFGNQAIAFAGVRLGNASARRMNEAGYELSWTLAKQDQNDDVIMDVIPTIIEDCDAEYDTTYALLSGSEFDGMNASRTYIVTCNAGPYSATSEITIDIDSSELPTCVTLTPSAFTAGIGETIFIPKTLTTNDHTAVPKGIEIVNVRGDEFFINHSISVTKDEDYILSFDESGIYTATITYAHQNIAYDVNVTFYIEDENGIVHVRTEELALDESYLVLVQGETQKLNYSAMPLDAYDTSVTWFSDNENIATVDQKGVITAINPGTVSISCVSNDGTGVAAMCAVTVERFLQLDDSELNYTVYTGGNNHAELGIINVTVSSEERLLEVGLNVNWSIEKMNGDSCDIAFEEFRAEAENGITVSGNRIKLLRIRNSGDNQYRISCQAGGYEDECIINIRVVNADIPTSITLDQSVYYGRVSEVITIDTSYCPNILPDGTTINIRGGNAFENALSDEYDFTEPEKLIFSRPGTFTANVEISGDNYHFICPITINVMDENGSIPVNITDVLTDLEYVNLLVGEQTVLNCVTEPSEAIFSKATWSSSDTSIATVSSNGKVTAISAGMAFVSVSVLESDFYGTCMVIVEDGLTLQKNIIERTVYVDGVTRIQLDTVQLTSASSQRLEQAPEWLLERVDGNNLTLKANGYNTVDSNGNIIYGCEINLYSISRAGDTCYELTCMYGDETTSVPITVHAIERNGNLPSGLQFAQSTYTASVNELIRVTPNIKCLPNGTQMPEGMRVALEGDALFSNSINASDYCVSQQATTISFNRAGIFEANYIYSYSNVNYVVPVTFRIMDSNGSVPVLALSAELSSKSLWLTEGKIATLTTVFTPTDADNKAVIWTSTNTSVATVDQYGMVTAVGKGQAYIVCKPDDPYLSNMICAVTVEDYLSIETGENHIRLYKQGNQFNEVFSALLTPGTIQRLNENGITPEWRMDYVDGEHSKVVVNINDAGDSVIVNTTELLSNGSDNYCLTCRAGDYFQTVDFEIEVIDLGNIAESISATQKQARVAVGQTAVLDFTPVCYPVGSQIPQNENMWTLYSGIGSNYYEAIDFDTYAEDGDKVTIRFNKAGRYLLSRQFFLDNLHYEQVCEIVVGGQNDALYGILQASTIDSIVYVGGTTGTISEIVFSDGIIKDVFSDDISWKLEHITGDSLDAILKKAVNGVKLVTIGTNHPGNDVWRITGNFGEYSESIDIRVEVSEPRYPVPETVKLSVDCMGGMIGNWLTLPIAVSCEPSGTALPEMGDDFWTFQPNGMAADVCKWKIEDGLLRVNFLYPGYYTGYLCYEAGNYKYTFPVYITVTDEEGVITRPTLEMYVQDVPSVVYLNGQSGISIGVAELSHGHNDYYAGESMAYMNVHSGTWNVSIISGTSAGLSIRERDINTADIILDSVSAPGTIDYKITCTVDGRNYEQTRKLTVLESAATSPNPTMKQTIFYAVTGEKLTIPTTLYERSTGAILQGASQWYPADLLLPAIGYEYEEKKDLLQMTFYKEGRYESDISVMIGNVHYDIPFAVIVSDTPNINKSVLKMPPALTVIDDYAFEDVCTEVVDLRGTRVTRIGNGSFRGCTDLEIIYIPSTVTDIADNAFDGCLNLTIICESNSAADKYAGNHNIPALYE